MVVAYNNLFTFNFNVKTSLNKFKNVCDIMDKPFSNILQT